MERCGSESGTTTRKVTIRRCGEVDEEGRPMKRRKTDLPKRVKCLHIIRKHKDSRRPFSWRQEKITCTEEEAVEQIKQFEKELMALAPKDVEKAFRGLASTHSDCGTARRGGDLGSFRPGKMQKAFDEVAFQLDVGEMSELVKTDSGVHL